MLFARVFFRARVFGLEKSKISGGVLFCSNHQSFFDPIIVGMTSRRRLSFLARDTLFRSWIGAKVLRFYGSIPVQREGNSLGAIRATLKQLKSSEAVLIFPEGTRTQDGSLLPLRPGFCAIARRGKVPILPVAIDGAYDAWPRSKRFPRFSKIAICYGKPIESDVVRELDDEQLVQLLSERIQECFEQSQSARR